MNFEDLTNKTITIITDLIIEMDNQKYEYFNIPCSYYKSENDIKKLGSIIKNKFSLDEDYNDIIESYFNDYFIFKFRKIYIIININNNCICDYIKDDNSIEYKIIKVFDRKEALIYRYGNRY
jgi:hypothetical protein